MLGVLVERYEIFAQRVDKTAISRTRICAIGRRKEMFYLTTHSTHFYLRLYGVRHMVKGHSDIEKGNPLPPHMLLFLINSKCSFICTAHRQDSTYHGLCYTSRGALAGTRNSSMGSPHEGSIRQPIAPRANALTNELHFAPLAQSIPNCHCYCY